MNGFAEVLKVAKKRERDPDSSGELAVHTPLVGLTTLLTREESGEQKLLDEVRQALNESGNAFVSLSVRTHRIGRAFAMFKGARLLPGEFGKFISQVITPQFGMSPRTVQRMMARARDLDRQIHAIREANATEVADLTAEQIIEQFRLVPNAFQTIGFQDTEGDDVPANGKLQRRSRKGTAARKFITPTPSVLATRIIAFIHQLDLLISEAIEPQSLTAVHRLQGVGAFAAQITPQPRTFANGLTTSPLLERLKELLEAYQAGTLIEGLVLLRTTAPNDEQGLLRDFPRVEFRAELSGATAAASTEAPDEFLCECQLVFVGPVNRLSHLQQAFADIGGNLYVPYRYLEMNTAKSKDRPTV